MTPTNKQLAAALKAAAAQLPDGEIVLYLIVVTPRADSDTAVVSSACNDPDPAHCRRLLEHELERRSPS